MAFPTAQKLFHPGRSRSPQICQADETRRTYPLQLPTPEWGIGATAQSLASAYNTFARSSRILPGLLCRRKTCLKRSHFHRYLVTSLLRSPSALSYTIIKMRCAKWGSCSRICTTTPQNSRPNCLMAWLGPRHERHPGHADGLGWLSNVQTAGITKMRRAFLLQHRRTWYLHSHERSDIKRSIHSRKILYHSQLQPSSINTNSLLSSPTSTFKIVQDADLRFCPCFWPHRRSKPQLPHPERHDHWSSIFLHLQGCQRSQRPQRCLYHSQRYHR